jgi:hypothetical protein
MPAIAVLPLADLGDDPTREYFADGLTQDIISALGRFSELSVMSWNAVFPHKRKPAGPREIGRSLAVCYLVEGSVRQTGDRVRVPGSRLRIRFSVRQPPRIGLAFPGSPVERCSAGSLTDAETGHFAQRYVRRSEITPTTCSTPRSREAGSPLTRIMHHMPRFCMPGPHTYCPRTPSIRPVWIGVRQLAVQRVWV